MAVLVARPINALHMAGLTSQANGKRKAPLPIPLPTGANIVDLTVDEDDDDVVEQPVAKRQKSQPLEDSNHGGLLSQARDPVLSSQQKHRLSVNSSTRPSASTSFDTVAQSQTASQSSKQASRTSLESSMFRSYKSVQDGAATSNGTSSSAASETLLPRGYEKKVNANGKDYYIDPERKTTSWNPPKPIQVPDQSQSRQKALNNVGQRRLTSTPDSESEDVLQAFRLPQTTAIKFKADADINPLATVSGTKPRDKTKQASSHLKKRSYDYTDVERVKTIFSSSPRTVNSSRSASSSNTRPSFQAQSEGTHQRQSQRETRAPERLITEAIIRPTSLPSRTVTPRLEAQREQTPQRSQISVIIPASQHKIKQPLISFEENQSRKKDLLRHMKRDVTVVSKRAESVEDYFGTTGFSATYGTASDDERLKKIHKLQPNAKKVNRKNIKLDWGEEPATKPFQHDKLVHPREQVKEVIKVTMKALTSGPPVTLVNDIDDRQLNGKFQFISEYVIREGVKRQPPHLNAHINCSDTCSTSICSPSTCSCLRNANMQDFVKHPVPTYRPHPRGDGLIVLNPEFITLTKEESAWTEIVECNNNCPCDSGCYNRLVQKGRILPLEIFMTQACGFGLRCPRDVVKGQFIDVYLGEIVTEAMLIRREQSQEDGEPSYLFSLDWFNEKPNYVRYQIDGANFGTPMRFINHSCNANCSVFPVMLKEYDQNIYGLAVFAIRDIPAMTELTLDYAPQLQYVDPADFVKCQCGEKNCRGYLWPKFAKRARRRKVLRD